MASGQAAQVLRELQSRAENKARGGGRAPSAPAPTARREAGRSRRAPALRRPASTATRVTRSGRPCPTASSCASSAAACTAAWACTSALCGAQPQGFDAARCACAGRRGVCVSAAGSRAATWRRSVTMDSWSPQQLKMMQAGGNDGLNKFVAVRVGAARRQAAADPVCAGAQQYGVSKETDPRMKYNTRAAAVYRDKIKAVSEGRPWTAPPVRAGDRSGRFAAPARGADAPAQVEKESVGSRQASAPSAKPLRSAGSFEGSWGWDDSSAAQQQQQHGACYLLCRRAKQSSRPACRRAPVAALHALGGGPGVGRQLHGRPAERLGRRQGPVLCTQVAGECVQVCKQIAPPPLRRRSRDGSRRPAGLPPSQGGKYVGFGSAPPPQQQGPGSSQVRMRRGLMSAGAESGTLHTAAGRPVEHGVHGHQPADCGCQ
jgi:hypothetical protein